MQQPLAKMSRRLTDRASVTKIRAVSPRTFSEVLLWHDFIPAALARLHKMDDTTSRYMPQVICVHACMLSHMSVHKCHAQAQFVMSSVTLVYRYTILLGSLTS